MAITKTVLASGSYVSVPGSTTVTYTPPVEPVVFDGKLVPGDQVTRPGIFTSGTATESTSVDSRYSSNN